MLTYKLILLNVALCLLSHGFNARRFHLVVGLGMGNVMLRPVKQIPSSVSPLRRALELWPYLFIAVSIAGLAYISLNVAR